MTELANKLLTKHYCREGESIADAFKRACDCFATDPEHSLRLQGYLEREWFMFSSPILSNAVLPGEKIKGLPISCFLTYVDDSIAGLCEHTTEVRWLSVKGGGVGGHWSNVRSMSDVTPGVNGFLHTVDADMVAYRQGKTRRGSYASYLNIDHPEIIEFIKMRTPTGDLNRKNLNLHHGVNITDDFITAVDRDLDWCLIDPHSLEVTDRMKARELWEELLTTRFRTGEPYINYLDEANDKLHPALREKGLQINGSNLCLTGDTMIPTLVDGVESVMSLKDIVDSKEDIKVLSQSTISGKTTYEKVTAKALMSKKAELYEIEDEDGNVIRCTGDHKIYTQNRGYVRAEDLIETDQLCSLSHRVYLITNNITEKTYVGYTRHNISYRLHQHCLNATSGKDTHLYRSMRKHGLDKFTVELLESFPSKRDALEAECKFIEKFGYYNETGGGAGGWAVPSHKFDEWRNTISNSNSGEGNHNYSGYTDEEILLAGLDFFGSNDIVFSAKNTPSFNEFKKWSNRKYGMPLSYSKCRFEEYEGGARDRFISALKELRGSSND